MLAFKKPRHSHSIPAVFADIDTTQDQIWEQLDRYVEDAEPITGLVWLLRGEVPENAKTLIFRATRPEVIAVLAEAMAARGLCGYLLVGQTEVLRTEFQALLGAGLVLLPDAGQPLGGLSFAELRKTLETCVTRAEEKSGLRIPAVFIPPGDSPYDGLTLQVLAQLGLSAFAPHATKKSPGVFGYKT